MRNFIVRAAVAIHVWLYRVSKGKIGNKVNDIDVLLLTTYGRKSGKKYVRPVIYLKDGNDYTVMAAYGGSDKHPGWYWNAAKGTKPVQIEVKGEVIPVTVSDTEGTEYDRLYQIWEDDFKPLPDYETRTDRKFPILKLTPQTR